jgi:hypothetical protein
VEGKDWAYERFFTWKWIQWSKIATDEVRLRVRNGAKHIYMYGTRDSVSLRARLSGHEHTSTCRKEGRDVTRLCRQRFPAVTRVCTRNSISVKRRDILPWHGTVPVE